MDTVDEIMTDTLRAARRFLGRWSDPCTKNARDDMAQEATMQAWTRRDTLRCPERFVSFVRTISRRLRYRLLRESQRRAWHSLDCEPWLGDQRRARGVPSLTVAGVLVDQRWCLEQIDDVLAALNPLTRAVLLGFYEGFSCAELADRYEIGVDSVKVRLHRGRQRVRKLFEGRVRALGMCG